MGVRAMTRRRLSATESALERAQAGAAWLDAKLGRGWRRKIRRRDLDMAEPSYDGPGSCGCILAQLSPEGDFWQEAHALGLNLEAREDQRLGFDSEFDAGIDYNDLNLAWKHVLRG